MRTIPNNLKLAGWFVYIVSPIGGRASRFYSYTLVVTVIIWCVGIVIIMYLFHLYLLSDSDVYIHLHCSASFPFLFFISAFQSSGIANRYLCASACAGGDGFVQAVESQCNVLHPAVKVHKLIMMIMMIIA